MAGKYDLSNQQNVGSLEAYPKESAAPNSATQLRKVNGTEACFHNACGNCYRYQEELKITDRGAGAINFPAAIMD
jgi:hypothetical protein